MRLQKIGAGVVLVCPQTRRILLALRNDEFPTWGIIGGTVEEMEHPLQCAKREMQEEAGFVEGIDFRLKYLEPLYVYHTTTFVYYTYLGVIGSEKDPMLNFENTKFVWVSLEDAPYPLHFGVDLLFEDETVSEKIQNAMDPIPEPPEGGDFNEVTCPNPS